MTTPKNPRRVAAGRRNRAKRGPVSDATRQLLSAAAKKTRPWEKSTGPKTESGKAKTSQNRRGKGQKPATEDPPLIAHATELLGHMASVRRQMAIDPQTARVVDGNSVAEALQGILAGACMASRRREVDALLDDVQRSSPED